MKKKTLKELKEEVKNKTNVELVLIATNVGFRAIDEDAEFMANEFNLKTYRHSEKGPLTLTISFDYLYLYKNKLDEIKMSYAFLSIVDDDITREIQHASDTNLVGMIF